MNFLNMMNFLKEILSKLKTEADVSAIINKHGSVKAALASDELEANSGALKELQKLVDS